MVVIDREYIENLRQYIFNKTKKWYMLKIKDTPKDLMVSCPFHKDGQENKPSCGIKKFTDDKGLQGTVHCFSCGVTTDIKGLLEYTLGNLYNPIDAETIFNVTAMQVQSQLIKPQVQDLFELPQPVKYISNTTVNKYKHYTDYVRNRGINQETSEKYCLGYDSLNKHIIFPIKDKNHRCLAFGRRSIEKKQYIYPPGFVKPLYGISELPTKLSSLFVVEGPFNLWSLSQWGKSGVALLGTGTEKQYKDLLDINCINYVLALDPDEAGRKGTKKLGMYLLQNNKKVYVCLIPEGKDVNDLTQEQFNSVQVVDFKFWYTSINVR